MKKISLNMKVFGEIENQWFLRITVHVHLIPFKSTSFFEIAEKIFESTELVLDLSKKQEKIKKISLISGLTEIL